MRGGLAFHFARSRMRYQIEPGLLRADKPKIHLRQKLAVEQRAMLRSRGIVDPVSAAQRIEVVRAAGMLAPRERQRIGDAVEADRRG